MFVINYLQISNWQNYQGTLSSYFGTGLHIKNDNGYVNLIFGSSISNSTENRWYFRNEWFFDFTHCLKLNYGKLKLLFHNYMHDEPKAEKRGGQPGARPLGHCFTAVPDTCNIIRPRVRMPEELILDDTETVATLIAGISR